MAIPVFPKRSSEIIFSQIYLENALILRFSNAATELIQIHRYLTR